MFTPVHHELIVLVFLQDMALIEALWKQDVDLGVPREVFEEDGLETLTDAPTKDKDHGKKVSCNIQVT